MKKFLSLLPLMLMMLFVLPACNEDTDEADNSKEQQLIGTWRSYSASDNVSQTQSYRFTQNEFTYTKGESLESGTRNKGYSVSGVWNVQKGTLQLSYDLQTLRCDNMSDAEIRSLQNSMTDNNTLLAESNKKGHPYGATVTFETQGSRVVMRLSGNATVFERVGM